MVIVVDVFFQVIGKIYRKLTAVQLISRSMEVYDIIFQDILNPANFARVKPYLNAVRVNRHLVSICTT